MELELTLVTAPPLGPRAPVEFTLSAVPGTAGSLVSGQCAIALGSERSGGAVPGEVANAFFSILGLPLELLRVGQPPLVSGAVVVAGNPPPPRSKQLPPLALLALSGPDAGCLHPLPRGVHMLGRGSSSLPVEDPELSRNEAQILVSATGVEIRALSLKSSLLVNGHRLNKGALRVGDQLCCGHSRFTLMHTSGVQGSPAAGATNALDEPLTVNRPPATSRPQMAALVLSFVPLVIGLALVLATGSWMFAAFAAMPALMGVSALFSGRRRRRAFSAEVRACAERDGTRRLAQFPSPAGHLLNQLAPTPVGAQPPSAPTAALALRLGVGALGANVACSPPDPRFVPPTIDHAPFTVPLTQGAEYQLSVGTGHRDALVRAILMQLSANAVPTLIIGFHQELLLAARLLHSVRIDRGVSAVHSDVRVVLVGPLCTAARWRELRLVPEATVMRVQVGGIPGRRIMIQPGGKTASIEGTDTVFSPDLCTTTSLARLAALQNRFPTADAFSAEPDEEAFSFGIHVPLDQTGVEAAWHSAHPQDSLCVVLGSSVRGLQRFNFDTDGPHLLLAGTTGSGKSELLRTILTGLVCSRPPDQLNLVLIDFKGGSGLQSLAQLPHLVAAVTDLDDYVMDRTITSLEAEVASRERLFFRYGAADIREYLRLDPLPEPLPRLVIAVDEFRIMVDRLPATMAALMKLATVGRSLGIHLVLATQRPQGAISSDIRANITSSICLRVQSPADSTDVIGSPLAATLEVSEPGVGYLRRGGEQPMKFRSALAVPAPTSDERPSIVPALSARSKASDEAVEPLELLFMNQLESARTEPARGPIVAPELPALVEMPGELPRFAGVHTRVFCGLVDVPQRQCIEPLFWRPAEHGHLAVSAVLGGATASIVTALVAQLLGPDGTPHIAPKKGASMGLYLMDGDGSLTELSHDSATVGYLRPEDLRTLPRLLAELAEGRAEQSEALLVVSSFGAWQAAFRSSPWPWLEDQLTDLARDGLGRGIVLLVTGQRELMVSRLLASIPNRVLAPKLANPELLASWPRLPSMAPLDGRAYVLGPMAAAATGIDEPAHGFVAQLINHRARADGAIRTHGEDSPWVHKIVPLPQRLSQAAFNELKALTDEPPARRGGIATAASSEPLSLTVYLGVSDGSSDIVSLAVRRGTALLAVGGPGTGKSTFLRTLAQTAQHGAATVSTGTHGSDEQILALSTPVNLNQQDSAGWIVFVDDADRVSAVAAQHLVALAADGATLIMTATHPTEVRPELAVLPGLRTRGLALRPTRPQDGEFFGVRLECFGSPPMGRAVLVDHGRSQWIQLPGPS